MAVVSVTGAAAVLAVAIFALKSGTPIWDDGAVILAERYPLTWESALRPFHMHLNLVPIVLWGILQGAAQLLAALLVTHVALATATAAFLISRLGPVPGFALSLPLALLGTAHYDLLMPWQILFSLALLAGVGMTWLAIPKDRTWPRRLATVGLGVLAVATSNVGIFVLLALWLWFYFERRVRQTWELVPPVLLWIVWFAAFGRGGMHDDGMTVSANLVPYAIAGWAGGLGGIAGLPWPAGYAVLAVAVAYLLFRRPAVAPVLASFTIAITVMYVSLSFFRGAVVDQAAGGRYIYLVGFLLAMAIAAAAPRLPARPTVAFGVIATVLNVGALVGALPGYP